MKRFTEAGRLALQGDNFYAALSLALMIPDICGSIEDPGPGKSRQRYERWCEQWVVPKFTGSPPENHVFLTAANCYQLRCSLIHSGRSDIEESKRKDIDHLAFFDNTCSSHCNYTSGIVVNGVQQPKILQLKAANFSETLYLSAEEWDLSIASDAALQAEKAKLLTIHSHGDAPGGIHFG